MTKRRLLLESNSKETIIILKDALFYPIVLRLPESVRESMPAAQSLYITKRHVMRFFNVPSKGDFINFGGHVWRVIGLSHTPRVKGSPASDHVPEVITEYFGAVDPSA